jgi:3-oxoacyl-[acyl-carrier-protein] synthase-3
VRAFIEDIEYYLPERIVTNADLEQQNPSWNMGLVAGKAGVFERRIAAEDETSFDLAVKACEQLFQRHDVGDVDGLIFCTQTPDLIMPSNAFLLHRHLELREETIAFDYTLACSGFIYGLAMIQGFLAAGLAKRILLVTAETYSKFINKRDRSSRVLFGDGAAAAIVSASDSTRGIIDIDLATVARHWDRVWVPAGGFRQPRSEATAMETTDDAGNVRSQNDMCMDGMGLWAFVNSTVPKQVRRLLTRNAITIEEIDLVLFHQGSKLVIDSLVKALGVTDGQLFSNLAKVGNTVSASIPIALKDAWTQERVQSGDKVLLAAFGAGLSAGALLMEV